MLKYEEDHLSLGSFASGPGDDWDWDFDTSENTNSNDGDKDDDDKCSSAALKMLRGDTWLKSTNK